MPLWHGPTRESRGIGSPCIRLWRGASVQGRLGAETWRSRNGGLDEYAPDAPTLDRVLGFDTSEAGPGFAEKIRARVADKLRREPVEDFRIDFEDGYGNRQDEEEDGHAQSAAKQVALGLDAGTLPPFIGIRIKPLSNELHGRSLRTLDIFVTDVGHGDEEAVPAELSRHHSENSWRQARLSPSPRRATRSNAALRCVRVRSSSN